MTASWGRASAANFAWLLRLGASPVFFSIPACGLGTVLSHRLGVALPPWLSLPQTPTANGPCPRQTLRTQFPTQASLLGRRNQIESPSLNRAKASVLITFLSVFQILPSGTIQDQPNPYSHLAALQTLKHSVPQIFNFSNNRFLDPSLHSFALVWPHGHLFTSL